MGEGMSDVIVVGGGPAGACLTILLGRAGLEVELFEQSHFPREKPCGEGLLPAGVGVVRSLGLEGAVGGARIEGVRYHVAGGAVCTCFATASGESGLGQRRLALDAALWNAAVRTEGVRARDGQRVDGPIVEGHRVTGVVVGGQERRARLVVAADGSSSPLRRALGLERTARSRRVGVRAHFLRPAERGPLRNIEIVMKRGYELYVTPLPGNEVLVAALAYQDAVAGSLRRAFRSWLAHEPFVADLLDGATQTSELMGRAPLVRRTTTRPPQGLVLLGDAASSVDPITAGGMSLALVSARLLADRVPEWLAGNELAERRFERARARAVRVHQWLGAGLLALARHPSAAVRARNLMQAWPAAMRTLVGLASGGAAP
jgi:flavin-dependent dehydrogenase